MKTSKYFLVFLFLMLMAGPGCESFKLNPSDLELNLSLDIIKTNINLTFVDATTQQLIGEDDDTRITLNLFGQDEGHVVDPSGYRKTPFQSSGGFAVLSLDPYKAIPSLDDTVKFTVVTELDEYVSTSKRIRLTREGDFDYRLEMVHLINPPIGVVVKEVKNAGNTAADGNLSGLMEIKTENDEAKFTINEGTKIMDSKGAPLVGELKVNLVHFDASKREAISAFPGGLDVEIINEDGSKEEALFITAGFASIEITDATGKKASNFQKGALNLDMRIDPGIYNPKTGYPVAAGDRVPVWSYGEETGVWKFENYFIVKQSPMGLYGQVELPHLSWWNLGWAVETACDVPVYFKTNDLNKTNWTFNYIINAQLVSGTGFQSTTTFYGKPRAVTQTNDINNTLNMRQVPPEEVTLTFSRLYPCEPQFWVVPGAVTATWCDYSSTGYDILLQPFGDPVAVLVQVYINCTNNGQRIKPTQTLQGRYRVLGSNCWIYKSFSGGETTVTGVQRNATYEIQAYYDGSWQPSTPYQQFVGDEEVIVFEPEIDCGG